MILTVMFSVWFTGVAAAQLPSPVGPPLTLYQLGTDGKVVAASSNVFSSGQEIWAGVPSGVSPPYTLTVTSPAGLKIWSQQNSSLPANGLIPLSLAPALFSTGGPYIIALQVMISYSPGFFAPQTSMASFSVVPAFATMLLKTYSFTNSNVQAQTVLQDSSGNPVTGVRVGLFLVQGNTFLQITTEKTDMLGRSSFNVGESLSGGNYQFQIRVLDSNAVFASPVQFSGLTVNLLPTSLTAWNSTDGRPKAMLLRADTGAPVQGRLLVLEQQLKDGNWTILTTLYTDANGLASFSTFTPSGSWHVVFNGDSFYVPSASDVPSVTVYSQPISLASYPAAQWSTFLGNTFSNGHITLKIEPSSSTIYDSSGQTVLGHMNWEVQFKDNTGQWQSLPWDGPLSMGIDASQGYHRVTLQGTAGNDQVAVSMSFLARARDALFRPLQMPVDLQALRGSFSYRIVWHLDGISAAFFQFEQRIQDQRTVVRGPITAGSRLVELPSGENSMVALAQDGKTVLFGLNWDKGLQYYLGTGLGVESSGATASVQFGDVALSSGQHWIIPACPCPDGGGGGGGLVVTSTTLYLPSSPYATVSTVLKAQVKDSGGIPVASVTVNFYRDGSLIGSGTTNSTGYASLAWTPGVTGSHAINATFTGNCCYSSSSSVQTLTINQTPTTIEILKPQQIAFSWDPSLPIVLPTVTLSLSLSGNGNPAQIYMPSYSGPSTTPQSYPGYGWQGLNNTSVTFTLNGTYTQAQIVNWTRNIYLPACPQPNFSHTPPCAYPNPPPNVGHLNYTAALSPPSTLYASSSTAVNIPYQVVTDTSATSQLLQNTTPPSHLYVNVTATYPFLSVTMQNLAVALGHYFYSLYPTLGPPLSSYTSNGYTYYTLPPSSYYAYVCTDPTCKTAAAGVAVGLLNSSGKLCGTVTSDSYGIVSLSVGGTGSCSSPFPTARIYTAGNTLTLSELFGSAEHFSSFYTNFQGYAFSLYAPLKTGHYYLSIIADVSCTWTVIYPGQSYPNVNCPAFTTMERILNVEKHPIQVKTSFNPQTTTILDKTNATIQLTDQANSKPFANVALSYTVAQTNPGTGTVLSGSFTSNKNGTATISIGQLAYGNYSLTISWAGNATDNSVNSVFTFTVYKAKPTLVLFQTPTVDGSAQAFCPNTTSSCAATLSTTRGNDIIIVFASETLDLQSSCTFSISDTAGLIWKARSGGVYGRLSGGSYHDQLQEFWAVSSGILSSDTITESITGCGTNYNGLQVFAISGANFNSPFDPGSALPGTGSDSISGPQSVTTATLSTTNPYDMVFAGVQHGTSAVPTAQSGFTTITTTGGYGTEFEVASGALTNFAVSFSFSTSSYWQMIADALQAGNGWVQNAVAGATYTFTTRLANNATSTLIGVAGLSENVYVNGALLGSYTTNSDGNVVFSWTPATAGQYSIKAVFPGQNYYTNSSTTIMVSVARRNVVLAANNSPQSPSVNVPVTWGVYARDMIGNSAIASLPISLFINGANSTVVNTNSTGYAVFNPYTFGSRGSINITFVSAMTGVYNSARNYDPLTVYLDTKLTAQAGTIIVGQQNSFSLSLNDANGVALTGRVVQIKINGAFYLNVTTDSNGQAQFNWRPDNTGSYGIAANFNANGSGDTGYRASSSTLTVNVAPQPVTNTQSTSSGTQSVTFQTAQGTPQSSSSGFSVSVIFPSLGWININIQLGGRSVQASLHIWNEFGVSCTAWVWGVCVMVAPWWHVHFDASSSLVSFSHVTDFFTGDILSQFLTTTNPLWVDQNSAAFQYGQLAARALIFAATAAYGLTRLASSPSIIEGGIDDTLATSITAAVWFAGASAAGLGGFLAYQDKQSRLNYLGGMASGFGLSLILQLFSVPIIINPVSAALWLAYRGVIAFANVYSKPTLFFSALTVVLAVDEVFLLEGLM